MYSLNYNNYYSYKEEKLYTRLLYIIVLSGPILDLFTGYFRMVAGFSDSSLSPGVLFRGFILIPVFLILSFRSPNKLNVFIIYLVFVFIISLYANILLKENIELVDSVNRFLKILFPIIGFSALIYITKKGNVDEKILWKLGAYYGLLIGISIIITGLYDIGLKPYSYLTYSSKAFFKAQNDTGLSLIVAFPFALYYYYYIKKNTMMYYLAIAVFVIASIYISSRAVLIGMTSILIIFVAFTLFKRGDSLKGKLLSLIFIVFLTMGISPGLKYATENYNLNYITKKMYEFKEGDFRRGVPQGIRQIKTFGTVHHLLGAGENNFPLTENDLVDIYGKFGVLTLLPLLYFIIIRLFYLIFIYFRKEKSSPTIFILMLCFISYIGHGAIAGHAFTSAQVNNLFMLVYLIAHFYIRKNRVRIRLVN